MTYCSSHMSLVFLFILIYSVTLVFVNNLIIRLLFIIIYYLLIIIHMFSLHHFVWLIVLDSDSNCVN